MSVPKSNEARRFFRAAGARYSEAFFLLENSGFTTAAVYLAGYAVECMLKALVLSHEPRRKHAYAGRSQDLDDELGVREGRSYRAMTRTPTSCSGLNTPFWQIASTRVTVESPHPVFYSPSQSGKTHGARILRR
jgi:hypothetical protein